MISKFRTTLAWAVLCSAIILMTIPSAHALVIGGERFAFLCSEPDTEPTIFHTKNGPRILVISTTTTVLKGLVNGKNRLRHFIIVKLVNPDDGSVIWTRPLTIQSLAIATVFSTDPPAYFITEALMTPDRTSSPALIFPTECLGAGVVESGGTQRVAITLGTAAYSGGSIPSTKVDDPSGSSTQAVGSNGTEAPVIGQDKSIINTWMLNIDSGAIARVFKPRAKPKWYFLPISSGIFDADDDGNDELVITRTRFIGEDRYDFMYEIFNIMTGALESTTTTIQNNKLIIQQ